MLAVTVSFIIMIILNCHGRSLNSPSSLTRRRGPKGPLARRTGTGSWFYLWIQSGDLRWRPCDARSQPELQALDLKSSTRPALRWVFTEPRKPVLRTAVGVGDATEHDKLNSRFPGAWIRRVVKKHTRKQVRGI